mmetsp:Transcript_67859/g.196346  ORF Transcript_67859/g.196346 Transcript_67859/m.196346 type:complete len:525 (+) Transcript_67859:175-1749(+)
MKIRLRPVTGEDFDVEIDADESVDTLRCIIISQNPELGEDPDDIKLIYKGQVLTDGEKTIEAVGIKDNEFMALMSKRKASPPTAAPAPAVAPAAPVAPAAAAGGAFASGLMGPPPEEVVTELCGMGFPRDEVLRAMQAAFNNAERATEYLLDGNIPPPPQDAAPSPAAPPSAGGAAPLAAAGGATPLAAAGGASWAEGLFGPQLLTKAGLQSTSQALAGAKVVLVYFSAHWCPPCRQFTPGLARAFEALGKGQRQVQVVFSSMDRDVGSFNEYYGQMPWFAMPFGNQQGQMLGTAFGVRGIPAVVALNGGTGTALDTQARDAITRSNFDLAACCRGWGVPVAAEPVVAAPTPAAAPTGPPKKPEPEAVSIDTAAAESAFERIRGADVETQDVFCAAMLKVLNNVLQNPQETKFRSLKKGNAALQTKLFNVADGAAVQLLTLAGWEETPEVIQLASAPDGRCTAVRDALLRFAEEEKMKQLRRERDAKIAEEIEKDKSRPAARTYGGSEDGRHQIGRGKPSRGGG